MLGEKRNNSLFGAQGTPDKKQVQHMTVDRDGEKKELPLYFGPDWPVGNDLPDDPLRPSAGTDGASTAPNTVQVVVTRDETASFDGAPSYRVEELSEEDHEPKHIFHAEAAAGQRAHSLFFTPENEGQNFNSVLQDVQEYISGKYSALITEGGDEDAKAQIKRYITKYVQDRRIAVKGYSGDQLVDALYTEMAEFGLLTKYIFGTGIEEINVNSWRDIEVLYANGETVKLEEHFDSPEHAVNVIRRMLHVSGMVLDNASPAVLGHLSKNIRIAVLKTPLVDEDVGVTASIRIVNPQNMQKEDFVKGGTATGPMLDFLAAFYGGEPLKKEELDTLTVDKLESILAFANKAASITTSRHGAIPAMPTLAEVEG